MQLEKRADFRISTREKENGSEAAKRAIDDMSRKNQQVIQLSTGRGKAGWDEGNLEGIFYPRLIMLTAGFKNWGRLSTAMRV